MDYPGIGFRIKEGQEVWQLSVYPERLLGIAFELVLLDRADRIHDHIRCEVAEHFLQSGEVGSYVDANVIGHAGDRELVRRTLPNGRMDLDRFLPGEGLNELVSEHPATAQDQDPHDVVPALTPIEL